jgi:hypothetical protein
LDAGHTVVECWHTLQGTSGKVLAIRESCALQQPQAPTLPARVKIHAHHGKAGLNPSLSTMQGDMDQGLLEMASARGCNPLALLQFFPSLLRHPADAVALLPAHQRSRARDHGPVATPPDVATALPYLVTFRSRLASRVGDSADAEEDEVAGGARSAVDYALMLAWLQVGDYGALLALFKQGNAIGLQPGVLALRGAGAYRELVRCHLACVHSRSSPSLPLSLFLTTLASWI